MQRMPDRKIMKMQKMSKLFAHPVCTLNYWLAGFVLLLALLVEDATQVCWGLWGQAGDPVSSWFIYLCTLKYPTNEPLDKGLTLWFDGLYNVNHYTSKNCCSKTGSHADSSQWHRQCSGFRVKVVPVVVHCRCEIQVQYAEVNEGYKPSRC